MEILKRDAEQAEVCRTVYGYFDSNQIAVDESKQALAKVSELVEAVAYVYGDPDEVHVGCDVICPTCRIRAALQAFGGEG